MAEVLSEWAEDVIDDEQERVLQEHLCALLADLAALRRRIEAEPPSPALRAVLSAALGEPIDRWGALIERNRRCDR